MTRQMPKRITITLPNPVYDRLTALSEVRDKPPATLAAESVERLVEQAVNEGEIADSLKQEDK
jgi:predicted DNA-binding protein